MTIPELIRVMDALAWERGKKAFTLQDICRLAGEPPARTAMALMRAAEKGMVAHAGAGECWMRPADPPDLVEVALAVEPRSYLSFEWALHERGIMPGAPVGVASLATTSRPRRIDTRVGSIRFVHLAERRFFGHDERRIALPEKALLDLVYVRGLKERSMAVPEDLLLERIDWKSMGTMSIRFPDWVWQAIWET